MCHGKLTDTARKLASKAAHDAQKSKAARLAAAAGRPAFASSIKGLGQERQAGASARAQVAQALCTVVLWHRQECSGSLRAGESS